MSDLKCWLLSFDLAVPEAIANASFRKGDRMDTIDAITFTERRVDQMRVRVVVASVQEQTLRQRQVFVGR